MIDLRLATRASPVGSSLTRCDLYLYAEVDHGHNCFREQCASLAARLRFCTKNEKSTATSGSRLLCGPRAVAVLARTTSSRAKKAFIIPDM